MVYIWLGKKVNFFPSNMFTSFKKKNIFPLFEVSNVLLLLQHEVNLTNDILECLSVELFNKKTHGHPTCMIMKEMDQEGLRPKVQCMMPRWLEYERSDEDG